MTLKYARIRQVTHKQQGSQQYPSVQYHRIRDRGRINGKRGGEGEWKEGRRGRMERREERENGKKGGEGEWKEGRRGKMKDVDGERERENEKRIRKLTD